MSSGALKTAFSFLFSFKGRIKRLSFTCGTIITTIIFFLPYIPLFPKDGGFFIISIITFFFSCYVSLALNVKRLRDCNHSLWLLLIYLVPLIGIGFWFYLMFKPSVPKPTS